MIFSRVMPLFRLSPLPTVLISNRCHSIIYWWIFKSNSSKESCCEVEYEAYYYVSAFLKMIIIFSNILIWKIPIWFSVKRSIGLLNLYKLILVQETRSAVQRTIFRFVQKSTIIKRDLSPRMKEAICCILPRLSCYYFLLSWPGFEPTRTKSQAIKIKRLAGQHIRNVSVQWLRDLKQERAEQCQFWLLRLLWTKKEVKDTNKVQMLTTE